MNWSVNVKSKKDNRTRCMKCEYMVDVPAEGGGRKPSCCFGYPVDFEHDQLQCEDLYTEIKDEKAEETE